MTNALRRLEPTWLRLGLADAPEIGATVAGVEVTWSVSGGGSITPIAVVSGADDVAREVTRALDGARWEAAQRRHGGAA